jgi:hypothetical protein
MKTKSVRFIKRFVLFTKAIVMENGKLVPEPHQYHIDFGEYHKVITYEPRGENSVFVEFANDDPFKGTATIDKSCIEMIGGGHVLTNPCCDK